MSSPHEQNTTIGDLMLRKSTRSPRDVRICPLESLLPTNRLSRDPLHLARIQQDRVAPPSLEGEEPLRFGVDLRIDVVWLGPIGVGRVEGLEIRHQMRAVEDSGAEIAHSSVSHVPPSSPPR